MRKRLQQLPARSLEPVAGAGADVGIGVVDGGVHEPIRVDDGRRLQVVGRDALALHVEDPFGNAGEPSPVECECDVETRHLALERGIGRFDIGGPIAVGHVVCVIAERRRLDLPVADGREAQLLEHGLDRASRLRTDTQHLLLRHRLDATVDLPVPLHRQPLVDVVRVVVPTPEGVVVPGHDRVTGCDEIGARQELAHQLRGLANCRVRRDRVVAAGDLEIEPRGDQVLAENRPRAAGHGEHERDTRDRSVLHALRAGRAYDGDAARLEVEHRHALCVAHERLRPCAGGEAHLDATRGVGGTQERLRPWGVVPVDEHRLRAVDGQRFRVGDEAVDRELEVASLLDGALRHHAVPARLGADEQRDRVQRCIARHPDRGLHLGKAPCGGLGRVGGKKRRTLFQVRHVRLVPRCTPCPQLLEREHQLDGVEHSGHPRELRRRQPAGQPNDVRTGNVDVDEHPRDRLVRTSHRLCRDLEVEAVRNEKTVDDVEVPCRSPVQAGDDAVDDHELRLRVVRTIGRHEAELGKR